jgi:serine protease AprX
MVLRHTLRFAVVLTAIAVVPGKAVWGENTASRKLDRALQTAVGGNCSGDSISVIIRVEDGQRKRLRDSLSAHGRKVRAEFSSIDALAAEVGCEDLKPLAAMSAVSSISIDAPMEPHSRGNSRKNGKVTQAEAAAKLQAPVFESMLAWPQLRAASYLGSPATTLDTNLSSTVNSLMDLGFTGAAGGVGVGIIDSGIAPGAEFGDRVTAFYDFTGGIVEATSPADPYGHGTHVAGLIGGEHVGVAPGARLVGLRVLDGNGRGSTADVLRAIEFAIANKAALNLHILNLSLGHPIYESAATDPLVQAVERAVRHGFVVVVSAGNFGISKTTGEPGYAGIASPGNAPSAITVGATNMHDTIAREDDRVSVFSSRGPSWYDGFLKPDVVAPGENILSVAATGSRLRQAQALRGNTGGYMRLSGTSMSAGITSGVLALVIDINPALTPNALKALLQYSAIPVLTDAGILADTLTQGAGQINGGGAISLAWVIDATVTTGLTWLKSDVAPSTVIGDTTYIWYQAILWGARKVSGEQLIAEQRPSWDLGIVWGEGLGSDDDNIVWGNLFADDDNIVWGNALDLDDNIVWGNNIVWGIDDDNIVWGNLLGGDDDNIVWGNNIVWGSGLVGLALDDDNIVWGNLLDDDNIVWGNLDDDNIVWGNLYDDNIVWGNSDDDNIVWGNGLLAALTGKGGR